jgi:RHS repeat-associated protein
MLAETTSRHFEWNHNDQMKVFRTQAVGTEPSIHAHYLYDSTGQRVKKLVRKQGGQVEVTHYIDGVFEHHRWESSAQASENNHVHVMDDQQRIALVRLGAAHPDDRGPAVQFHLGDHLGSTNVVVDSGGALVNREEFTPYGETSFGSFARKRYRFTGKERDEESGIVRLGSRCFLPWVGSFVSADPHCASRPNWSSFCYASDNPINLKDPTGQDPLKAQANLLDNLGRLEAESGNPTAAVNEITRLEEKMEQASKLHQTAVEALNASAYQGGISQAALNARVMSTSLDLQNALNELDRAKGTARNFGRTLKGMQEYLNETLRKIGDRPLTQTDSVRLNDVRQKIDTGVTEIEATLKERLRPTTFSPTNLKPTGGLPPSSTTRPRGGGGGGRSGPTIWNELSDITLPKAVGWGFTVWDLGTRTIRIFEQDTLGGQVTEVAGAGGAFAGFVYGTAACAEFGPGALFCGAFGAFFGEEGVRGAISIALKAPEVPDKINEIEASAAAGIHDIYCPPGF